MLVSPQTAMKGGDGFEIARQGRSFVRRGLGRDTKYSPSCSKYALEIKLVFGRFYVFDIANTEIQT